LSLESRKQIKPLQHRLLKMIKIKPLVHRLLKMVKF
jgi:hypothetical protein